jgi:ribonuclease HII
MQRWWSFLEKKGFDVDFVVGVDEAGRAPLAGPVCVAGVVLPKHHGIKGLDDSKVLSEKKREMLFDRIQEKATQISIAYASAAEIDRKGIFVCVKHLMRQVIRNSGAEVALIDAVNVDLPEIFQLSLHKADHKIDCVAAASIIAKVSRDRLMKGFEQSYPGYGLAVHKGYPTKAHREAVKKLGMSEIHRRSFCAGLY